MWRKEGLSTKMKIQLFKTYFSLNWQVCICSLFNKKDVNAKHYFKNPAS